MSSGSQFWLAVALLALGTMFPPPAHAQASPDGLWQEVTAEPAPARAVGLAVREPWVQPEGGRVFHLNVPGMATALAQAPLETARNVQPARVQVPLPDGRFAAFDLVEAPIMAPELAARFPEIRTYYGVGVDDPSASARIDFTPAGFHAQVLSASGAVYVDPYWKGDPSVYASYRKSDYKKVAKDWACHTPPGQVPPAQLKALGGPLPLATGATLRTFRLACAATGEYTQFHGGTVNAAMAAVVTTMNRVVGIYERELSIRMELVPNNHLLIYTNSATDPYSNDNGSTMLGQNQSNLTMVIGSANYDIGHVLSTGGGGVAYLGCVCSDSDKARGVTGSFSPMGDAFDVDYVAHEMGHQFGANHSFNGSGGSCSGGNRNPGTAYEPGSGTTIMGYAGICGADDIQPHSDAYFHSVSLDEISAYVAGISCGSSEPTGNNPPVVSAGADYTIPAGTPFTLTASGSDPDDETVLFCWEQRDIGPQQSLSAGDNGQSPLFRSFPPTTSPSRTFPRLSDILSGLTTPGERLPTTTRTMHFRVTARDNRATGGATSNDAMIVQVTAGAGPFKVTSPNTSVTWSGTQTVTWNVANTTAPPVSTASVSIRLSTDGGETFPIVLAASTPNDGSETITLPDLLTTQARIKVQAVDNIYFDISDANFTINPPLPVLFVDTGVRTVDDAIGSGNGNARFDPGENPVRLLLQLRNEGLEAATSVTATLTSLSPTVIVKRGESAYPNLNPGASGLNVTPFILYVSPAHVCGDPVDLQLAVSSDAGGNVVDYSFPTGSAGSPQVFSYTGPAVAIPDLGMVEVPLVIDAPGTVLDLNFRFDGTVCSAAPGSTTVGLSHTWVGDLVLTLISPSGTQVLLANRPGSSSNGGNNFCNTIFDDEAGSPSIQSILESQSPYSGTYLPISALSAFDNEPISGTWRLRVQDAAGQDTGHVRAFSLVITTGSVCTPAYAPGDFDHDGDVDQTDYEHLQVCMAGALVPASPACLDASLDIDLDADQSDFGIFQRCMSGVDVSANPDCAN